jgi:hypothetical protein
LAPARLERGSSGIDRRSGSGAARWPKAGMRRQADIRAYCFPCIRRERYRTLCHRTAKIESVIDPTCRFRDRTPWSILLTFRNLIDLAADRNGPSHDQCRSVRCIARNLHSTSARRALPTIKTSRHRCSTRVDERFIASSFIASEGRPRPEMLEGLSCRFCYDPTLRRQWISPSGKSAERWRFACPAPSSKIFLFPPEANQFTESRRPDPQRGVAQRHQRGTGCGGRGCA